MTFSTPILPRLLLAIPLAGIRRIDASLEGDWSGGVTTIWEPGVDGIDLRRVARSHPRHRPSLELCFADGWVGLPCCRLEDGRFVFDEALARAIVAFVEARLEDARHTAD